MEEAAMIRETVMEILKESDMDRMTESKVRRQAAERLSMDLSNAAAKKLVRKAVEDFLADRAKDDEAEEEKEAAEEEEEEDKEEKVQSNVAVPSSAVNEEEEEEEAAEEERPARGKRPLPPASSRQKVQGSYGKGDSFLLPLSNKRNLSVQDFRGRTLVSIRDYYEKNGELLPGNKGISLSIEQWEVLKKNVAGIEKAIAKLQS